MLDESLPLKLIRETALRLGIPHAAGHALLQKSATRPRLGQLLDQLRAAAAGPAHAYNIGDYQFMPAELSLIRGGVPLRLTEKERDILLALLLAPDFTLERKTMLERVWGYASGVETHTLETHIYRLRQKIESDPAHPVLLVTNGEGYRLDGGVGVAGSLETGLAESGDQAL